MRSRKNPFCLLLATASCVLLTMNAVAQTNHDATKEKAIRHLLELTGTVKQAQQVLDQLLGSLEQNVPNAPQEFWTEFRKKANPDEFVNMIVPIYSKHYTKADIDGLIAFYETPLGRKVVATLPDITKESMTVGQQWGRAKAEEVMRELQKRQQKSQTGRKDRPHPQVKVATVKSS